MWLTSDNQPRHPFRIWLSIPVYRLLLPSGVSNVLTILTIMLDVPTLPMLPLIATSPLLHMDNHPRRIACHIQQSFKCAHRLHRRPHRIQCSRSFLPPPSSLLPSWATTHRRLMHQQAFGTPSTVHSGTSIFFHHPQCHPQRCRATSRRS